MIKKDENKYKDGVRWICQCECGNIKSIRGSSLKSGNTKSCGCLQTRPTKLDLTGKKFGRLTVLEEAEKPGQIKYKQSYWLCACDCGVKKIVRGSLLVNGQIKSCGCLRKDSTFKDLTGQQYGLLTVKSPLIEKTSNGSTFWLCECKCGNMTKVSVSNLLNGHVKSCGCHRISFGEQEISTLLEQNKIKFKREYTFPDLFGKNNGKLRFDFCIFNIDNTINRLIEFQGAQHYEEIDFFSSPQENDIIKINYCIKNKIPLIHIPYWIQNKITLDDILSDKYKVVNAGDDLS